MSTERDGRVQLLSVQADRLERQIAATLFAPYYYSRVNMAKKVISLASELLEKYSAIHESTSKKS